MADNKKFKAEKPKISENLDVNLQSSALQILPPHIGYSLKIFSPRLAALTAPVYSAILFNEGSVLF